MAKIEQELKDLKSAVVEMWALTHSQLSKSVKALALLDKDLAREVGLAASRVNSAELKIDRDCEDILAIYSPVAIDLRFLLAILKINTNLERIGDIAEGIAKLVIDTPTAFRQELLDSSSVIRMFEEALQMIE